jgi:hypothetical protein
MVFVKHMLAETTTITSLNLSSNGITDTGLQNLAKGVADNLTLEQLDVSGNKIKGGSSKTRIFIVISISNIIASNLLIIL